MLWNFAGPEYQRAGLVTQAVGNRGPLVNAIHHTVIAIRNGGEDRLIQFSETCSPEEATEDLPYVSIGSGQQSADPFLAFLRRTFWERTTPTLEGAIFATVWTLDEIIQSSPGKLGYPITIATLQNGNARVLDEDDWTDHKTAVKAACDKLREFQAELRPPE